MDILVPPSLAKKIGNVFLLCLPQEFQANFFVQFLLFSLPGHIITHTPGFSSFVSAYTYNSQIYISSHDMLQASDTQLIKNPHSASPCQSLPPLEYLPSTQMWQTPSPNLFCPIFLHMAETTFYSQVTISNFSLNCSKGCHLPWTSYLSSCHGRSHQ